MADDRPTHDSDWWSFVQAHELGPTDEPTYLTFSGPDGSGVTIVLPDGTEIEVTLGQGRNGYPSVTTVTPGCDRYPTPYGDPLRHTNRKAN